MHIAFDRPGWLLLLALLVPVGWLGWKSIEHLGRPRAISATVLRAIVVLLLAAGLSRPSIVRSGEGVSVVVVADASRSVPLELRQRAQSWIAARVAQRGTGPPRFVALKVAWPPVAHAPAGMGQGARSVGPGAIG